MAIPSYESLGGDGTGALIMSLLLQDYAEANHAIDDGTGVWESRTWYDIMAGMPVDVSCAKHRREWRVGLGLPPIPVPEAPIASRTYVGNMCGIRMPGAPAVVGGSSAVQDLVLSWFYDRYPGAWRAAIRDAWRSRGQVDVLLSWPDSRAFGHGPSQFAETCRELVQDGFQPCVMLLSKDYDPRDVPGCLANVNAVLPLLVNPRIVSRICIGWELSLWLSPTQVQELTDAIVPSCLANSIKTYVHFQQGYASFQQEHHTFADYWNANIGKLTGVLHQKDLDWSDEEYQSRMNDILLRFAGQFFCSPDSGFGHPFDCIALEITAQPQYLGQMSEDQGNAKGRVALGSPTAQGPFGTVQVMGSGNGS